MQKLKQQLCKTQFNPKQCWDWENESSLQQLILSLTELKSNYEEEISQNITAYNLGKQRAVDILRQTIPQLNLQINIQEQQQKIGGLLEVVQIKRKVDQCLHKLNQILEE